MYNPCFSGVKCTNTFEGYKCGPCPVGYRGGVVMGSGYEHASKKQVRKSRLDRHFMLYLSKDMKESKTYKIYFQLYRSVLISMNVWTQMRAQVSHDVWTQWGVTSAGRVKKVIMATHMLNVKASDTVQMIMRRLTHVTKMHSASVNILDVHMSVR